MSGHSIDLKTPRNVLLTAFYKRSFAHHTVKNRMPVIITQLVDGLARSKEIIREQLGDESSEELKTVIGDLSKLKYEIQTNKELRPLISVCCDVKFYNDYIASLANTTGSVTYFSTIWLLAECYMYRRVREAFELTTLLRDYDPFQVQKQESFISTIPHMINLGLFLLKTLDISAEPAKDAFVTLLKSNLWGNKCDLSLSNGVVEAEGGQAFNLLALNPNILSDYSNSVWLAVNDQSSDSNIIDIIFDNAGYELFTDFCLADYLISTKLAKTVRFYVKTIPWFISDVMTHDVHWMLDKLQANENEQLATLATRWRTYLQDERWLIVENSFWTLPISFNQMSSACPSLYMKLAEAKLAIFKGDLNYRKLFGERNWDPSTSVEEGLQGFHPTRVCTLRTVKADIVCGLEKGVAERVEAKDAKWMESGNYGLIQFSDKVVKICTCGDDCVNK